MSKISIVGTGLALSALFTWSIALAQSQSVTPAPAVKAPTQIAQGTTGIPSTITRTALGQAPAAGGALAAETAVAIGGGIIATGAIVQNSSVTEGAAATATK